MLVYISIDMEGVAGVVHVDHTCAYRAPDAATLIQVIQAWTMLAGTTLV